MTSTHYALIALAAIFITYIALAVFRAWQFDRIFHSVMGAVTEDRELDYRAALICIRNQGLASKSGTARSMASKASEALK